MTQQGEGPGPHRDAVRARSEGASAPEAGDAPPVQERPRRRPSPRLWAALSCVVVVGLGAALWVDRSDGAGLLSGSQDATGTGALAGPGPASTSSADPDAFAAERYFPAEHGVDEGAAPARRTASRQGPDCADVVQGKVAGRVGKAGCSGYVGATYTRADGAVLTTVTVLRFADDEHARRAAGLLGTGAADVTFALPDDTATDAVVPLMPASDAQFSRVAAVRGYVTVTSSAFSDGHKPTVVDQDQLEQATRTVAHAAGVQLMWT